MLVGMKCTVKKHGSYPSYDGVIASGPSMDDVGDWRLLVLSDGEVLSVDVYYLKDIRNDDTEWSDAALDRVAEDLAKLPTPP